MFAQPPIRNRARPASSPSATMPGARWFPGVTLNYVDQILRHTSRPGPAIIGIDEDGTRTEISWAELPARIGAVAAELRRLGVGAGDTVAGYLPDMAEAMIAFLATAAIGAVWSACGQDYAPQGAAARLGQLEPKVLFSATDTGSTVAGSTSIRTPRNCWNCSPART